MQPSIIVADGPTGPRARIAGTGLEVFEVIDGYLAEDKDWSRFRAWFPWLTENQLQAAVDYYVAHPEEIEAHLVGYGSDQSTPTPAGSAR